MQSILLLGVALVSTFSVLSNCHPQFGLPSLGSGAKGAPEGLGNSVKAGLNFATGSTLDVDETVDFTCRPGYGGHPGDAYASSFAKCHDAMKTPGNETRECVRVCQWQELRLINKETETANVTAIDMSLDGILPVGGRAIYAKDFETCFNETKPKLTYEEGCKANQAFTKCFHEKADIACGKPPSG